MVVGKGINPKTKEIKDAFVIQQVSINVVDYMALTEEIITREEK